MPLPLNRRALLAAGAALVLLAAGCGEDEAKGSTENFDVLFIGGVTGPAATTVAATTKALEAAAKSINEHGGIKGRNVVVKVKDSQGDARRAVSMLQEELSGSDLPDVVIPSGTSAEALAMVPLLTRSKIVSIAFGASPLLNDPQKYPYHFQSVPNSAAQLTGLRKHLEAKGAKRLGLLVSQDEYGKGVVSAVKSQLEGSGIEVKNFEFVPTDIDLSVSYRRMLDANPDVVYIDTTGDAAVRLLQARVQTGAVTIPTIAGSGMSLTAGGPFKYGSPEANKNLEILVFKVEVAVPEAQQSAVFKDFLTRYSGGQPIQNSLSTPALAWDQLRLIAAAAAQDGALADLPGSLVKAVYNLKVDDGYWLTEKQFTYSADKHTPTPTPDDFPFIPSAAQVNGQYQVGS
ncbi:ABC transporter substrate-binding protein [Dactylosporangium sp. AC04546]|uniref:ABC transporter substrate-binding protein n=1 Tax=Dactylosporangium sp. AC04546 TaxID=2862460 RepID=UPI001EE0E9D2|nr:ABC transporter substrate-binding protein [Dactylosporangium sp. AC04546]WVK78465.1 ABC transporter substrate-binding protein [Dactylosporangium sp. AC04546]